MLAIRCSVCGKSKRLALVHTWVAQHGLCSPTCAGQASGLAPLPQRGECVRQAWEAVMACRGPLSEAIEAAGVADRARRRAEDMERTDVRVGGLVGFTANATAGALAEAARNEQTAFAGQVSAHLFELENKLSAALPLLMGVQAHGVPVVEALVPIAQLTVLNHDATSIPTDQVLGELHQLFSMLSGVASGLSSTA